MKRAGKWIFVIISLMLCLGLANCVMMIDRIPPGEIPSKTEYDHFITINGVNLHYEEYPGDGDHIVLLHGFGSSAYTWNDVSPILNALGYHVWALDMKGFGWSDKPLEAAYDPHTLMEEVNAFMEAKGLSNVTFAGNSLGGYVGTLLALKHPEKVKNLVLVDAAGQPSEGRPTIVTLANMPHAAAFGKLATGSWVIRMNLEDTVFDKNVVTKERVNAYFDRLCTKGGIDAQVAVAKSIDFSNMPEHASRLGRIKAKTLIIWGENDTWISFEMAKKFRRDIPGSILAAIPECGHIPQEEKPKQTAKLIADFASGKSIKDTHGPAPPE